MGNVVRSWVDPFSYRASEGWKEGVPVRFVLS